MSGSNRWSSSRWLLVLLLIAGVLAMHALSTGHAMPTGQAMPTVVAAAHGSPGPASQDTTASGSRLAVLDAASTVTHVDPTLMSTCVAILLGALLLLLHRPCRRHAIMVARGTWPRSAPSGVEPSPGLLLRLCVMRT